MPTNIISKRPPLGRGMSNVGSVGSSQSGMPSASNRGSVSALNAQQIKYGNPQISVVVRKRPMSKMENECMGEDIITCSSETMTMAQPKIKVDLTKWTDFQNFRFDHVFDQDCSNQEVYDTAVRPLVMAATSGVRCTCFAYGQTGSGKTYTMMGIARGEADLNHAQIPGVFQLAANDIFKAVMTQSDTKVYISFFEIYCDRLFDLMNERKVMKACEDAKKHVQIVGLTEYEVQTPAQLIDYVQQGLLSRSTGSTGANVDSSRSHAVLKVSMRNSDTKEGDDFGVMSFIDLAGSERGADTNDNDAQTRTEGKEINKSLLALKECIRKMGQSESHTPFRQSKLTQVLKDSFIRQGCRTVMIGNLSPSSTCGEVSLNTLRYADQLKNLKLDSKTGANGSDHPPQLQNNHNSTPGVTPQITPVARMAGKPPRAPVAPIVQPPMVFDSSPDPPPANLAETLPLEGLSLAGKTILPNKEISPPKEMNFNQVQDISHKLAEVSFENFGSNSPRNPFGAPEPKSASGYPVNPDRQEPQPVSRAMLSNNIKADMDLSSQIRAQNPPERILQNLVKQNTPPHLTTTITGPESEAHIPPRSERSAQHEELIQDILQREEKMTSDHRQFIMQVAENLKIQHQLLQSVSDHKSDIRAYVHGSRQILIKQRNEIDQLLGQLDGLEDGIIKERNLAEPGGFDFLHPRQ